MAMRLLGIGLKLQMSFFYISSQHYLQYGPERVFPTFPKNVESSSYLSEGGDSGEDFCDLGKYQTVGLE